MQPDEFTNDPEIRKEIANKKLVDNMSTRDFLLGKKKETFNVLIDGGKEIELKSYLTKIEQKKHKELMTLVSELEKNPDALDNKENLLADLLSDITIEEDLDAEFWISPDLPEEILQTILLAFFSHIADRMSKVQNFR